MGLEFESPAGHQKRPGNKLFPGCFAVFYELFCIENFARSDRVTNLLLTAKSDKRLDLFVQTTYVNKKRGSIATPESEQADSNTPKATGGTAHDKDVTQSPAEGQTTNHGTNAQSAIVSPSSNNSIPQTTPGVNPDSAPRAAEPGPYEKTMALLALGLGKDSAQTVDTENQAEYDNTTKQGGNNYAEGLQQNDRAGGLGDPAQGMAGVRQNNGPNAEGRQEHGGVAVHSGILRVSQDLTVPNSPRAPLSPTLFPKLKTVKPPSSQQARSKCCAKPSMRFWA